MYDQMTAGTLTVSALFFQTVLLLAYAGKLNVENEEQIRTDLAVISFLIQIAATTHILLNVI